ncbi:ABC transporter permease subunit [Saccharomonospora halophila]|uniref:ABC transporter permease subunit n=1 Tax=Saccharomonospora halophila TaxID=129922 RepID=UPI0003810DF5|nr:ABC transporter permease subunit [Saccharomonospora halophila]
MWSRNVLTRSLRDGRRALLGWTVAVTALAMLYGSFHTRMSPGMADTVPEAMRGAFGFDDLDSAAGYLQSAPFGILVPLLVVFFGAATGARAIAGDEDNGLLGLLLAHPVSRRRLLLERLGALAVGAGVIGLCLFAGMLVIRDAADLGSVPVRGFAAQSVAVTMLALFFGCVAVALGAAGVRYGPALGTTTGVGLVSYVLDAFGPQFDAEWLRRLSPFYYYLGGEPLRYGFQWTHLAVLALACCLVTAVALRWFDARDLR